LVQVLVRLTKALVLLLSADTLVHYNQANGAVALGGYAGFSNQGVNAVAVGYQAGNAFQGNSSIAIGTGVPLVLIKVYSL
jgi:hypothetical protein